MECEFDPGTVIDRLCAHHKLDPKRLLVALLHGLARYHCFGHEAFDGLRPADPSATPDVASEIEAYLIHLDPERHAKRILPASLLEAVMLCMDYEWQSNDDLAAELQDEDSDDDDFCQGMILVQRSAEQRVMVLAIKESINQIETVGLEMAIDRKGK